VLAHILVENSVPNEALFAIREVASRAGIAASAVRFYERAGLLRAPKRVSGRRTYDETVFESLALIQLAQDAGFTLAETKVLLHGFESSTPASRRWRSLARTKLEEITQRIEQAQRMRDLLQRLLRCRCESLGQCVRSRKATMTIAAPASRRSRRSTS
jgi:MerR family transcriptional regulator, redox-sensitive transcriptional activator SoxR